LAPLWDQITEFTVHRSAIRRPYFQKPVQPMPKSAAMIDRVMVKKSWSGLDKQEAYKPKSPSPSSLLPLVAVYFFSILIG
jgi:hypothetical protein